MTTTTKDRNHWLKIARCSFYPEDAERVADYCVEHPGTNVMHARWMVSGQQGKCGCSPCTIARGEPLR